MPKSLKCACGVRHKAHKGKGRRHQLPHTGLKTDHWGLPRPRAGARTRAARIVAANWRLHRRLPRLASLAHYLEDIGEL